VEVTPVEVLAVALVEVVLALLTSLAVARIALRSKGVLVVGRTSN
jgi:hypothetical protein